MGSNERLVDELLRVVSTVPLASTGVGWEGRILAVKWNPAFFNGRDVHAMACSSGPVRRAEFDLVVSGRRVRLTRLQQERLRQLCVKAVEDSERAVAESEDAEEADRLTAALPLAAVEAAVSEEF